MYFKGYMLQNRNTKMHYKITLVKLQNSLGNMQLVLDQNVVQRQTDEQMRIMGSTSLATFLMSLIDHIFASHVLFSNGPFYG